MVYLQNRIPVNSSSIPMHNNTVTYIRKERQGYVSILLPNSPSPFYTMANNTTADILEDMDGERTVKDLFEMFISKYTNVEISQLENDFSIILTKLWQSGIIVWKKGSNPFMEQFTKTIKDTINIRVAFEEDINELIEYFTCFEAKSDYFNFISETLTTQLFEPLQLRYALFNMTHIFFIIEEKNEVIGTVGISTDKQPNIGELSYVSIPENILNEVLEKIMELSKIASPAYLAKLRVYLPKNKSFSFESFQKKLNKCGFDFIALLKKEIHNKDVEMYDFVYEE